MKSDVIPSTWLEQEGRRLDCGPYLSGAIQAKLLIDGLRVRKDPLQTLTLGGIAGIINAGRISRIWVNDLENGIPFLSSTDILQADFTYLRPIAKRVAQINPKLIIHENYILITRAGTIGRMTYCRPDMDGMACSEDVMRVIPDTNQIKPGYLYAFLKSPFGTPLVTSGTYGAVIQHIEPDHIKNLNVPRLGDSFEAQVHQKVVEAAQLRTEYQIQVQQATQQLFVAVGLADITCGEWHSTGPNLAFTAKLNSPASLRAANFNPRFQELCDKIKSASYKTLGNICIPRTLRRGNRFNRIEADPDYSYLLINQKQLFWQQPEGRWIARFGAGSDVIVPDGTTLVAARGTLGESELYCRSEFISGPALERAYSEDLLRVIANEQVMPRGCLFAFMRSETAFRMLRSIAVGSKLQDHHYAFLPHLPVPYPDPNTQQAIHELVVDAYEKRHRSNVLENEAVAMVERAILEGV
ncbi:hypothetical protein NDI52_11830 [Leptolyngbya sp. PL-A3]|uniref:methylation-associated defense system restriction endonuclease subunit S MAD5 n=1 Tax=Leptolyngbya sp. PL-A3 TaxID=2933911 RepID=UPI003298967A